MHVYATYTMVFEIINFTIFIIVNYFRSFNSLFSLDFFKIRQYWYFFYFVDLVLFY